MKSLRILLSLVMCFVMVRGQESTDKSTSSSSSSSGLCPFADACSVTYDTSRGCDIECNSDDDTFPDQGTGPFSPIYSLVFYNLATLPSRALANLQINKLYLMNVVNISVNSFKDVASVTALVIESNQFETFETGSLVPLSQSTTTLGFKNVKYDTIINNMPDILNLTMLTSLELYNNSMVTFDGDLFSPDYFPFLVKLVIRYQDTLRGVEISYFSPMSELTYLMLADSAVESMDPESFSNNGNLVELILNNNYLSSIPDLTNLTRLIKLDMSNQHGRLTKIHKDALQQELDTTISINAIIINLYDNSITSYDSLAFCSQFASSVFQEVTLYMDDMNHLSSYCQLDQLATSSLVVQVVVSNPTPNCSLLAYANLLVGLSVTAPNDFMCQNLTTALNQTRCESSEKVHYSCPHPYQPHSTPAVYDYSDNSSLSFSPSKSTSSYSQFNSNSDSNEPITLKRVGFWVLLALSLMFLTVGIMWTLSFVGLRVFNIRRSSNLLNKPDNGGNMVRYHTNVAMLDDNNNTVVLENETSNIYLRVEDELSRSHDRLNSSIKSNSIAMSNLLPSYDQVIGDEGAITKGEFLFPTETKLA